MSAAQRVIKRLFDMSAAGAGLAFLSPAMAGIAIAIKLDSPGPALFKQTRLGMNGRPFSMLKFRTMRVSAGVTISASGLVENRADDDRHTRVGRVLRRLSLDELPQLINVLRGEMSIVGPRPDLPEAMDFYTPDERTRLDVKPGITGLAQVRGRNELDARAKWALDVEYARESSLALDARILLETARRVAGGDGVYR